GADARGTTLDLILSKLESFLLFAHSEETATRIEKERRNTAHLSGIQLPETIRVTADPGALGNAVDLVIVAVPSAHVRETVAGIASVLPPSADILTVVEGLGPALLPRRKGG